MPNVYITNVRRLGWRRGRGGGVRVGRTYIDSDSDNDSEINVITCLYYMFIILCYYVVFIYYTIICLYYMFIILYIMFMYIIVMYNNIIIHMLLYTYIICADVKRAVPQAAEAARDL